MNQEAPVVSAPEAAPVEAEVTQEIKQEPAEPKTYAQEEVDRLVAKVKKNERYRTKKEIEAYYQGKLESFQPPQEVKTEQPKDAPPARDQFDSYEDFIEAKAEYTGRRAAIQERERAEKEAREAKEQQTQAERFKSFQTKIQEKYPDLTERAESIAYIPIPPGVGEALAESDFGPDILNHFVENPKDFERVASLSQSAALREIGKLEARFENSSAKPEPIIESKKPSSAPAPLKPVGGNAVIGDGEPSHDNPEAWAKWRNQQLLKRKASK